jgi:4-hydroxy-3-polyprenylbenzoate decarboxylase
MGSPVEVCEGKVTGLTIAAWSEIVLEGEALADEKCKEGPFGEWTGYYASGEREEVVIRVKAVYYRNDLIILGAPPFKPPSPNSYYLSVLRSAKNKNELDTLGIPGIAGVWCPEEGGSRLLTVISINQSYPGHVKQVASVVLGLPSNAYMGRYVILVDEDVDTTDISEVLWALCTRTDPTESINFIRGCWSSPLDPMVAVRRGPSTSSRAVIDACRPFQDLHKFPELNYDRTLVDQVKRGISCSLGNEVTICR